MELVHEPDSDGICRTYCALCRANLKAGLNPDGTPRTPGLAYLIQSRDGFWWRPNAQGYTADIVEAGVFDAEASIYLLGEPYSDRQDLVVLARPHLKRAERRLRERMNAIASVEAGIERRA